MINIMGVNLLLADWSSLLLFLDILTIKASSQSIIPVSSQSVRVRLSESVCQSVSTQQSVSQLSTQVWSDQLVGSTVLRIAN